MTHASSDNLYGPATYIVDASAAKGSHTSIADAIAAASAGDSIFIRPGTYTENFTVKGGLSIFGAPAGLFNSVTKIVGKITHTEATETVWSDIYFDTNLDYLYSITGSNSVQASFRNCTFEISDNDAFEINNSNAIVNFESCRFYQTADSLIPFTITAVTLVTVSYCYLYDLGVSAISSSTIAAGVIRFHYTETRGYIFTSSGTGIIQGRKSIFGPSPFNAVAITTAGTGIDHQFWDCIFDTGTAASVSIGAGTSVEFYGSNTCQSSNANPITGAGTIIGYSNINFNNGSSVINATTINKAYTVIGNLSLDNGTTYLTNDSIKSVTAGSGDAVYQSRVAATSWTWGIDNSETTPTVDPWKLSQGTALGTNDVMKAWTSGEINYPLQPSFLAQVSGTATNVTGDGTVYTVSFGTEIYDQNNDFSSTTFTAPITGRYQLQAFVRVTGLTSSHVYGQLRIVTSNRTYTSALCSPWACSDASTNYTFQITTKADMDAADTATVAVSVTGGTLVVDVDANSFFSGCLEE